MPRGIAPLITLCIKKCSWILDDLQCRRLIDKVKCFWNR